MLDLAVRDRFRGVPNGPVDLRKATDSTKVRVEVGTPSPSMEDVRAPPSRRPSSTKERWPAITCLPRRSDHRDSFLARRAADAEPTIMPNKEPNAPSLSTTSCVPLTGSTLIGLRVHSAHFTARSTQSGTSGNNASEDAPSHPLVS